MSTPRLTVPSPVATVPAPAAGYLRWNQVGYRVDAPKRALLLAAAPASRPVIFKVLDAAGDTVFQGTVGPSLGSWSRAFPAVYALDFSAVGQPGTYSIAVSGAIAAADAAVRIDSGSTLYTDLLTRAVNFYQTQRSGREVVPGALERQPSHLADEHATVYAPPTYDRTHLHGDLDRVGGPVDLSGGWYDAGDYLKLVQTASYADFVMLLTLRSQPELIASPTLGLADEARFGLDWLQRMWDDQTRTLYYQVGIGDGNGKSIVGDHDRWRLPEADDRREVRPGDKEYFLRYRPALRAGAPDSAVSPNLAGRLAASFGLCSQIFRPSDPAYADRCLLAGQHVFDLARTNGSGQLLTASPHDYYPEDEWRDDLELGATELYFATAGAGPRTSGLPHEEPGYYLERATSWAREYIHRTHEDRTALSLYDVSGLAHYELHRALTQTGNPPGQAVSTTDLVADLKRQVGAGAAQAALDPFGLAVGYKSGGALVAQTLGYALEASLYGELSGDNTYRKFSQQQLDWVLGANAWGSSFVVGAGNVFPTCLAHQVANLSGSLNGSGRLLVGAVVNGPGDPDQLRDLETVNQSKRCPPDGDDRFAQFGRPDVRYVDSVQSYPSVEPALDYAALTLPLFARQIAGRP